MQVLATRQTAQFLTVPAPIGGLNVYDNLAAMPPTDAVLLQNFVPSPYGCEVRRGYKAHATGFAGFNVNSLVPHFEADGTSKLFAFAGSVMSDVTAPGAAVEMLTGLHSSFAEYLNISNSAGTNTVIFIDSGLDEPIWYSAGVLKRLIAGDGTAANTWAGVDPKLLNQGCVHQRRLWAVQKDSTLGWFLPADSFYGTANFFDFGPFFKHGGVLRALTTWSADLGEGSDDLLIAISSNGDVVAFAGTDVSDSTQWALRGVYTLGRPPKGLRFFTRIGGDLYILTAIGLVAMSTVVASATAAISQDNVYSKKVQAKLNSGLQLYGDRDGWSLTFFPFANLLLINVPTIELGGPQQLVANYANQAWCNFAGIPATSWAVVNDKLYVGLYEGVSEAWQGFTDAAAADGSGGKNVQAFCQQAYSLFAAPGMQKQVGMYKPRYLAATPVAAKSGLIYDYALGAPLSVSATGTVEAASSWNLADWDSGHWDSRLNALSEWAMPQGLGTAVSLNLGVACASKLIWVATDYSFKIGGIL